MKKIVTRILGIAFVVNFIDLAMIGVKIFDGNYDIAVEGAVGIAGFLTVFVCGIILLYVELRKRAHNKKG